MQPNEAALRWTRARERQKREALALYRIAMVGLVLSASFAAGHRWATASRTVTVCQEIEVQPGDTLWEIWSRSTDQRVNWRQWHWQVAQQNPSIAVRNGRWIQPGETLVVPVVVDRADAKQYRNLAGSR